MSFFSDLFRSSRLGGRLMNARDARMDRDYVAELMEGIMASRGARAEGLRELAAASDLGYEGLTRGVADIQAANPLPEIDFDKVRTNQTLQQLFRLADNTSESKDLLSLISRRAGETESDKDRGEVWAREDALRKLKPGKQPKFSQVIETETFGNIPWNPEPDTANPRPLPSNWERELREKIFTYAKDEDRARWLDPNDRFTEEGKVLIERAAQLYKGKQVLDVRDALIRAKQLMDEEIAGETVGETGDTTAAGETTAEAGEETGAEEELRKRILQVADRLLKNPEFDKDNPEHRKAAADSIAERTRRDPAEVLAMLMAFLEDV